MTYSRSHSESSERGQAALMITLGIVVLCALLGLVVDLGYGYYLKQVAQAAADSAALAGAQSANDDGGTCSSTGVLCQTSTCAASPTNPPQTNFDAACLYASANGFPSSGNQSVVISAGSGNPSNTGVTANYWLTATATQAAPLTFLRVLGVSTMTVSASATAAIIGNPHDGCIYVLDSIAGAAYNQVGTSVVQSNCGIYVNSSASDAMTVKGNATVTSSAINIVGGTKFTGGASVSPNPNTGMSPVADPFASLPAPSYSGCDYSNLHLTGGNNNLSPGVYCGGIQASGTATLNFSPGTYILNGGGMQITSSNVSLTGSGVFFYNTSNGYSFGPITIKGGATASLSAPTSGTYEGILFFQDRSISSSAASAFGGGSTEVFSGTIYLPTAQLDFAGGASTNSLTMALVVDQLNIVGNAYLNKDSTGTATGLSQPKVALVQ